MQIDFHHAVTYVVSRLAGLSAEDTRTVAHCSQYVDDATSTGLIRFSNKAIYKRISSAHTMLDARNVVEVKNRSVWTPFHFLPDNGGLPAGENPDGSFIEKLVCKPNSPIAQDMVRSAIEEQHAPYGLYRLGITMHVYADTWAHQQFAGVLHSINEVEDAEFFQNGAWVSAGFWQDILDDTIPPLGHGRASTYPDAPFLTWRYTDGAGQLIERDNTDLFCEAADEMRKAVRRFIAADPDAEVEGLSAVDLAAIRECFVEFSDEKGEQRHEKWLERIAAGAFSFEPEELSYAPRGKESWKHSALGSSFDEAVYTVDIGQFIQSDWKKFHDAVQVHRLKILRDILPRYGICAA